MSNIKDIGQVARYKPLARCGMEELAARQKTIVPSGGVLFARNADREEKDAARQKVLDLFHPNQWPGQLNMLTMPGLHWRFERKLLGTREGDWFRKAGPNRTNFTGVENDRSIYFASVTQMPGLCTKRALVKLMRPENNKFFFEMGVKTKFASYFFTNIDDLMRHDWTVGNPYHKRDLVGWDAAWLDFTGPMSVERLAILERFYHQFVRKILIVTVLKARWNKATNNAIERAGGHTPWLHKRLGGELIHDIEYYDTSPMAQIAIRHP